MVRKTIHIHIPYHRNTVNLQLQNLKVDASDPGRTRTSLEYGNYRSNRRTTVFIIHGFSNGINATWIRDMADAYLSKVSRHLNYPVQSAPLELD